MRIKALSHTKLWLSGMKALTAILALLMFTAATPEIAQAQSCQNVLQGHVDWATNKAQGEGEYSLRFVMVSNQLLQKATYAEGNLSFKQFLGFNGFGGTVTQYFNDNRWNFPPPPGEIQFDPNKYPFDPEETADLNVFLNATFSKAAIGKYTFDLKCDHPGVLYGVGNPQGPWQFVTPMFVISLKREFNEIIIPR